MLGEITRRAQDINTNSSEGRPRGSATRTRDCGDWSRIFSEQDFRHGMAGLNTFLEVLGRNLSSSNETTLDSEIYDVAETQWEVRVITGSSAGIGS